MGVVYKLTQDVIDFIVRQKTENPSVGCRQIADSVSQQFTLKISKSSVSTVLRHANLSGFVGRPGSAESAARRFQIPLDKKKELLELTRQAQGEPVDDVKEEPPVESRQQGENVENFISSDEVHHEEASPVGDSQSDDQESLETVTPSLENKNEIESGPSISSEVSREEETDGIIPNDKFWDQVRRSRQQKENFRKSSRGGALILYKMAEEAFFPQDFWSDLFKKYWPEIVDEDFDRLCRAAIVTQASGADAESMLSDGEHAIWQLYDIPDREKIRKFLAWSSTVRPMSRFIWDFRQRCEEVVFPVNKAVVRFGQTGEFEFKFAKSMEAPPDGKVEQTTLYRAVTWLFDNVVCNNRPLVMREPIFSADLGKFLDFLTANFGQTSAEMVILGNDAQPLIRFSTLPEKKRKFILSIVNKEGVNPVFIKESLWNKRQLVYCAEFDEIYHVSANRTRPEQLGILGFNIHPLTIVGVSLEQAGDFPEFFLLANYEASPREILMDFIWEKNTIFSPFEHGNIASFDFDAIEENSSHMGKFFEMYFDLVVKMIVCCLNDYNAAIPGENLKSILFNSLCSSNIEKDWVEVHVPRKAFAEDFGSKKFSKTLFNKKYILKLID